MDARVVLGGLGGRVWLRSILGNIRLQARGVFGSVSESDGRFAPGIEGDRVRIRSSLGNICPQAAYLFFFMTVLPSILRDGTYGSNRRDLCFESNGSYVSRMVGGGGICLIRVATIACQTFHLYCLGVGIV